MVFIIKVIIIIDNLNYILENIKAPIHFYRGCLVSFV